ncbi:hypothetical protein [Streptomyces sp. CA-106110]|uniref:hypothetical protein n=1 Tax=Streptomyces sp. CA-106110 TaxID=3240044 RepID=UPI003D945BE3
MDGIADMGGTSGWGLVHPPRKDEPVFAEPWHGRAFALALLSIRAAGANVDAFRHSLAGPRRLPGSSDLGSVDVGGGPRKQANTAPVDHGVLYASRSTKVPCSSHHHPPSLLLSAPHPACQICVRVPPGIKSAAWSRSSSHSPIRAEPAVCVTGFPPCWPWWSAR